MALTPEDLVPQEHPIRRTNPLADRVLQELSPTFSRMCAKGGRPYVLPKTPAECELADRALLRALGAPVLRTADLRHALPVVPRPEHPGRFLRPVDVRQEPDAAAGARGDRPIPAGRDGDRGRLGAVVSEARRQRLLSEEHFSVDGTLLKAWTSVKSVRARDEEGKPAYGGRWAQPVGGLPGRAAFQRDPCLDDGPGGAVGAQGTWAGGEAVLRRKGS